MRPIFRDDLAGVSPVIATILMVAITVVLASVLYVMVSGLLGPGTNTPEVMGVQMAKTGDGKNWSLTVVSTPLGLTTSTTILTIVAPNGATNVSKAFSALRYTTDGAVYVGTSTTINVGDRVLVDAIRYPAYYQVQISDASTVLYSATFV